MDICEKCEFPIRKFLEDNEVFQTDNNNLPFSCPNCSQLYLISYEEKQLSNNEIEEIWNIRAIPNKPFFRTIPDHLPNMPVHLDLSKFTKIKDLKVLKELVAPLNVHLTAYESVVRYIEYCNHKDLATYFFGSDGKIWN